MIHIVFNEQDIAVLQQAIALADNITGEIVQIKDDFSVGPIANIYDTEGYRMRRDWWMHVLTFSPYQHQIDLVDDKLTVHQLAKQLTDDASLELWLWMGQNAHDVCGYYWLMSQLSEFQGRIHVLYLNNLPFINEKGGIFYPNYIHQILPKELLKARRLARPITTSEFETEPDEWKKLMDDNGGFRLLEGGKKLASKPDNFFDKELMNALSTEPQKLTKILHQIQGKNNSILSDVVITWRLRLLAAGNKIQVEGDWEKGWKEIMLAQLA